MKFDEIKALIKTAIESCTELDGCSVTDAYPPIKAGSPVKKTICAIGLDSAKQGSIMNENVKTELEGSVCAFVDIYTPVSLGGDYSSKCALELSKHLGSIPNKHRIEATVQGTAFINTCYAFKIRVEVTVSEVFDESPGSETVKKFPLRINSVDYICRSVSIKNKSSMEPIECYGESSPTGYIMNQRTVTAEIKRQIDDDGQNLVGLSYPFIIEYSGLDGYTIEECAITKYELSDNSTEIVTITGREVLM